MGLQSTPAYGRVLSHPEILDRNVLRALFSRSGAARYGDFVVAPTGTTRQFSITGGRAHILGQESAQQGGYVAWSDASENQAVGAPSASPRIDTVLLRIYDEQYGTITGTTRAQWDIIAGTPGASPAVLPDSSFLVAGANYVPGAWWRLCDIRSNPGDTTIPANQIYPTNTFVRVPGGVTLCYSVASTTGFGGRPSDPVLGDQIYELDTKLRYVWNGTVWQPVDRALSATVATSESTANTAYVDLATVGPSVTISTGTEVIVYIAAEMFCSASNAVSVGVAVSGATTIAAADTKRLMIWGSGTDQIGAGRDIPITGLTPGVNTFTLKYRTAGGTATFANRTITVRANS